MIFALSLVLPLVLPLFQFVLLVKSQLSTRLLSVVALANDQKTFALRKMSLAAS